LNVRAVAPLAPVRFPEGHPGPRYRTDAGVSAEPDQAPALDEGCPKRLSATAHRQARATAAVGISDDYLATSEATQPKSEVRILSGALLETGLLEPTVAALRRARACALSASLAGLAPRLPPARSAAPCARAAPTPARSSRTASPESAVSGATRWWNGHDRRPHDVQVPGVSARMSRGAD
jgi:hypothetical protein